MKLTQTSTVDFAAVGTLVQLRNPSGATNWSKPASMYDEFKVVGMRLRVFFPKYISIGDAGGSAPAGIVSDFPTSIVACYDNDSITGTSYAVTAGYEKPFFAYPDGEVSFAITSLPTSSIAGSTAVGGSLATCEWCDVAFPNNMYGAIISYINRNYAGSWGIAPGLYTGARGYGCSCADQNANAFPGGTTPPEGPARRTSWARKGNARAGRERT
jgi:hypothetical protein